MDVQIWIWVIVIFAILVYYYFYYFQIFLPLFFTVIFVLIRYGTNSEPHPQPEIFHETSVNAWPDPVAHRERRKWLEMYHRSKGIWINLLM